MILLTIRAAVYNLIGVPVAAGGKSCLKLDSRFLGVLYPVSHYRLSPVWASLASTFPLSDLIFTVTKVALSSISVVCSSLALKLYKPPWIVREWDSGKPCDVVEV